MKSYYLLVCYISDLVFSYNTDKRYPRNVLSEEYFENVQNTSHEIGRQWGALLPKGYKWVNATRGLIPKDSFVGGRDHKSRNLYMARAVQEREMVPGYVVDGENCCKINFRGKELCNDPYEVLVGNFYFWVIAYKHYYHPDRVTGGWQYDGSNRKYEVYICKLIMFTREGKRYDALGKQAAQKCWIPREVGVYAGYSSEHSVYDYEILVGAADSYEGSTKSPYEEEYDN